MTQPDPQPFMGITTFARQPHTRDARGADVAIVGVPFDSGTSFRSGARFGPRKIREMSLLLWGYNNPLSVAPFKALRVIDYGDVDVVPVDIEDTFAAIEREAGAILDAGATVVALGGDHSIALPLLRAHARRHGRLAVVHVDSHPDTWHSEFGGKPYSHGTPFRRAIEENLIDTSAYIQIGIRGSTSGAGDLQDARDLGARVITIDEAMAIGVPAALEEIHLKVAGKKVYLSFDIDAVDPAFAPGTGTPEVGGFTSYDALQLVRGLQGLNLVGFDLVEVSPPYDHGDITAILASNIAFEFLSLIALKKG
ncbi:MAG TPA: agmatinase [Anaerolineae bacterium]|nr:agmatinase [Anaerolineae bacterium]